MLRLIGVKPISGWFVRQMQLTAAFSTSTTKKKDSQPRISHSARTGKKIPLKKSNRAAPESEFEELLKSSGVDKLLAATADPSNQETSQKSDSTQARLAEKQLLQAGGRPNTEETSGKHPS